MAEKKYTAILAIASIDTITVEQARRTFFAYKKKRVITGGSFDDDTWPVCDEYANYNLEFSFEEEAFKEFGDFLGISLDDFKKWLKTFIVTQMGDLALISLQNIINNVRKIISCPIDDLDRITDQYNILFSNRIYDFFSMIPQEGREEKLDVLLDKMDTVDDKMNTVTGGGQRTLAAFESYFRFNDILKRFWSESSDLNERLFFFPVWLWWNITAIIPVRPREFVLTPRQCITELNGDYFLSIRKNKIKGTGKAKSYKIDGDYEIRKYQIPEGLAKEIKWYLEATEGYPGTELGTLFIADTHYAKWERCKPYTSRFFTYINLTTCLRYFFEQIVQGRYGYTVIFDRGDSQLMDSKEINYLHLGDTRHLALINLIAEGATPMVAMMLAGHDNPQMSSHYYSNIATLIECRTYRQYKKLIQGKQTYALSKPIGRLKTGEFVLLDDNSRCYSERVRHDDFSDCYKVSGPSGEIGFCKNCTYHRDEGKTFEDSKELYRNRIINECRNLEEIVKKVRKGNGEPEEIAQVLLRLKDTDYSYQQYLLETLEEENAKE